MTNAYNHAKKELSLLVKNYPDSVINAFTTDILALCETFGNEISNEHQAAFTAHTLGTAIKKLCLFEVLSPLTGDDSEWSEPQDGGIMQNLRCPTVFKTKDRKPYFLDAILWRGEAGEMFAGTVEDISSSQTIKAFPFEPRTFYVDVQRVAYIKGLHKEKDVLKHPQGGLWVYRVKDADQLYKVFECYDKSVPPLKLIR